MALSSNIILAQTRVKNVQSYLAEQGIPFERMRTASYGGEKWDNNNDPYSERVEFRIFLEPPKP